MSTNLTQYKCDLSSTGMERLKCKYDPQSKKVLRNGVIVSNDGVGYPYAIKLEHGKIYSFDLSKEEQKFTVERLSKYLVEIGTIESENKKVSNEDTKTEKGNNTVETSTKTATKKSKDKSGKTKKDNKDNKEVKVKEVKEEKKEVAGE